VPSIDVRFECQISQTEKMKDQQGEERDCERGDLEANKG